jgi:hypothetical protein
VNARDWLLLGTFALAWYHVGIIWLVQLVAWPLFGFVGHDEFDAYHQRWWNGIKYVILVPGGLGFLGIIALLFARPPSVPPALIACGVALQTIMYALTALWYGPQQARMHDTRSPIFRTLNRTNWVRTGLVSGYGIVLLVAVAYRIGS